VSYNIFISHSWAYSNSYDKLMDLLKNSKYFSFSDYSVPKSDPIHTSGNDAELYRAINNKIRLCNCILIMAGVYSSYSKWINNEINIAKNNFSVPKPIIGITPWAQANISTVVQDSADEIVSWNSDSIVAAIRKYSN